MRVLVAGASGAVGVPLTRQLIAVGHEAIGLSRNLANLDRLRALGGEAVVADAQNRDTLLRALDGLEADAVIHQLTALKNASPRLRADDPTNVLRTQGTANLLAATRLLGAPRFLTQSLIFGAHDPDLPLFPHARRSRSCADRATGCRRRSTSGLRSARSNG